jgi:acyl carrier protein
MEEKVKQVLANIFAVDISSINDDSAPGKIKTWDSLRHMKMVLALEDEFGIEFEPEDISQMLNYKLIISIIKEKV